MILDATFEEIDIKTGLVRLEWHSLDHVNVNDSETSPPRESGLGLVPSQLDRPRAERRHLHLRAEHVGGLPDRRRGRADPLAARRPEELVQDGSGHADGVAARRTGAGGRGGHDLRRRLRPAAGTAAARARCASRSTSAPTAPPSSSPSFIRASHCWPAARATCRRLADGNTLIAFGGVPQVTEFGSGGALTFDAHLPST